MLTSHKKIRLQVENKSSRLLSSSSGIWCSILSLLDIKSLILVTALVSNKTSTAALQTNFKRLSNQFQTWEEAFKRAGCNDALIASTAKEFDDLKQRLPSHFQFFNDVFKEILKSLHCMPRKLVAYLSSPWELICLSGDPVLIDDITTERKLTPDTMSQIGLRLVHYVAISGSRSGADLLLKRGFNFTVETERHEHVFHFALMGGRAFAKHSENALIQLLETVFKNANKEIGTKALDQSTLVHYAAHSDDVKSCAYAADKLPWYDDDGGFRSMNTDYCTAFDVAAQRGCLTALLTIQILSNERDSRWLILDDDMDLKEYFFKVKLDRINEGETYHYAMTSGRVQMMEYAWLRLYQGKNEFSLDTLKCIAETGSRDAVVAYRILLHLYEKETLCDQHCPEFKNSSKSVQEVLINPIDQLLIEYHDLYKRFERLYNVFKKENSFCTSVTNALAPLVKKN